MKVSQMNSATRVNWDAHCLVVRAEKSMKTLTDSSGFDGRCPKRRNLRDVSWGMVWIDLMKSRSPKSCTFQLRPSSVE